MPLKANSGLGNRGIQLFGSGFILSRENARVLGLGTVPDTENYIREYRNGRDITDSPRDVLVIDLFGLSAEVVRSRFPAIFQHILTRVKPERDNNNRGSRRLNWWIFGEPNKLLRKMLVGLPRYIATPATSKHRFFLFLDSKVLPDDAIVSLAFDDAFYLGVLGSRAHVVFALAAGGTLEDRPRYNNTLCFDLFPFPTGDETAKARIRALGEELDAHRKRVQAQHPGLSLTLMYNVLEALRAGRALSPKEQTVHNHGLVSVLRQLHAAVAAAYGWPADLPDDDILTRLVALNAERAAEEAAGHIRWLRPAYQDPTGATTQTGLGLVTPDVVPAKSKASKAKEPWPKTLAERVQVVERTLQSTAVPITAAALTKRFARADTNGLSEILVTLAMLGRVQQEAGVYSV